jgi:hypothetical protein
MTLHRMLERGYAAAILYGAVLFLIGVRTDNPGQTITGCFLAGVCLVLLASASGFIK